MNEPLQRDLRHDFHGHDLRPVLRPMTGSAEHQDGRTEFDASERLCRAWLDMSKPGRLRGTPGPDQLAPPVDDDDTAVDESSPRCGIGQCDRTPEHSGPHRVYDARTFAVLQEWEEP